MRVAFSVTRERSREIIGSVGSNVTVEGPSNSPARSPATSRRRAWPTSRPSSVSRPSGSSAASGARSRSTTIGRTGTSALRTVRSMAMSTAVCSSGRQAAVEHGLGERADEVAAAGGDLAGPLGVVEPGGAVAFVERVEPVGHAVAEHDRPAADGFGDGGVFALGVAGHVDAAAEGDRAGVEALGEAGLAGADDAGEDEVRRGDQAAGVEDPGVVDERAAGVEVLADEDALAAQPAFGEERVRAGQRGGGVLVAGDPEPSGRPQRGRSWFAARGGV